MTILVIVLDHLSICEFHVVIYIKKCNVFAHENNLSYEFIRNLFIPFKLKFLN